MKLFEHGPKYSQSWYSILCNAYVKTYQYNDK